MSVGPAKIPGKLEIDIYKSVAISTSNGVWGVYSCL